MAAVADIRTVADRAADSGDNQAGATGPGAAAPAAEHGAGCTAESAPSEGPESAARAAAEPRAGERAVVRPDARKPTPRPELRRRRTFPGHTVPRRRDDQLPRAAARHRSTAAHRPDAADRRGDPGVRRPDAAVQRRAAALDPPDAARGVARRCSPRGPPSGRHTPETGYVPISASACTRLSLPANHDPHRSMPFEARLRTNETIPCGICPFYSRDCTNSRRNGLPCPGHFAPPPPVNMLVGSWLHRHKRSAQRPGSGSGPKPRPSRSGCRGNFVGA